MKRVSGTGVGDQLRAWDRSRQNLVFGAREELVLPQ